MKKGIFRTLLVGMTASAAIGLATFLMNRSETKVNLKVSERKNKKERLFI